MAYYRMHDEKQSEQDFIADASSWMWDFDDNGDLYERELPGVYSAFEDIDDLIRYYDGSNDDQLVAIFDGEIVDRPHSDARGEVLVAPSRLIGWATIRELMEDA